MASKQDMAVNFLEYQIREMERKIEAMRQKIEAAEYLISLTATRRKALAINLTSLTNHKNQTEKW